MKFLRDTLLLSFTDFLNNLSAWLINLEMSFE